MKNSWIWFLKAWAPSTPSPWCDVLNADVMDMMEYREDLKQFWTSGHGHEINSQVACFTLRDVLDNFRDVIAQKPSTEKAILYFSHSGMVLKLLAALDLFKDDQHLKCDEMMSNRKWSTSRIDPFGSNVAFVLTQCGSGIGDSTTFEVGLMVNERFVKIPGCHQEGDWCNFQTFEALFSDVVDSSNCNFETMCSTNVRSVDVDDDSMF